MKLIPFSKDLCYDLIKHGYSHFSVKSDQQKDDYAARGGRVTYKAIRQPAERSIPIEQLLQETNIVADGSYVMVAE